MTTRCAFLALLLATTASSALAQVNVSLGLRSSNGPPPGSIGWSTLGIVADGTTDNTAALNALPTNETVFCDTGAGVVRFSGQWVWQSNLTLYLRGCPIVTYESHAGSAKGTIDQPAPNTTAITNVLVDGLNISKPDLTYTGAMIHIFANHFTLTNWTVENYSGLLYVAGADQLISGGNALGSAQPVGNAGIRHFGNALNSSPTSPFVATRAGQAHNVEVINSTIESGDATYQNAPPPAGSVWDFSHYDFLWNNNFGFSWSSEFILVDETDATGTDTFDAQIANVTYSNMSGSGGYIGASPASDVKIGNQNNSKTVSATLQNLKIDSSFRTATGQASINVIGIGAGQVNASLSGVTVTNPYQTALKIIGNTGTVTFDSGTLGAQRITTFANIQMIPSSSGLAGGITVSNSSIATLKTAIQIGTASTNPLYVSAPSVTGNTITGVGQNGIGVWLDNVNGATVTGNTITPAGGTTKAIGVTLATAGSGINGTTNSTVTGNNVSAMTNAPPIICATGRGNTVTGNTGATDCLP